VFGKYDFKWLRSRSFQFTRDRNPARYVPGAVSSFRWRGRKLHYWPGSSDPEVIYKILLRRGTKAEYQIPEGFNPSCVWDIGANIGAASLYFSHRFPQAEIHCFEPVPENFAMIERNIQGLDRIRPHERFPCAHIAAEGAARAITSAEPSPEGSECRTSARRIRTPETRATRSLGSEP